MAPIILYGSQTGTAADSAARMHRELRRIPLNSYGLRLMMSCDSYDVNRLPDERLLILVVATTGQGEPPENCRRLYQLLLRRSLPADLLCGVRVAILGLGDSAYPLYNAVARRLVSRFADLGADVALKMYADDQDVLGVDSVLPEFIEACKQLCIDTFGLIPGKQIVPNDQLLPPIYHIELIENRRDEEEISNPLDARHLMFPTFTFGQRSYSPHPCPVACNRRLTHPKHWQDVRHIEFDVEKYQHDLQYEPGDIVLVHPKNDSVLVDEFITQLHLNPLDVLVTQYDTDLEAGKYDLSLPVPNRCTLRELFMWHLDVFGTPSRYFYQLLSAFAMNPIEKERLIELSNPEFLSDYMIYSVRERRSYAEVFQDFPSVHVPLQYLIELLPRLQPRQFSISSSPLAHPGRIHITMALINFVTPFKRQRKGTLSRWFADVHTGEYVPLGILKGTFRMPIDRPAIMIGPGTGIAPFRSMCWQRYELLKTDASLHPVEVYFGCRQQLVDFLYRNEWSILLRSNAISHFYAAFSRDAVQDFDLNAESSSCWASVLDAESEGRTYVQDVLNRNALCIYEALNNGAVLLLAGSSNRMPKDVHRTLVQACVSSGGMSEADAETWLQKLQRQRRYIVETWS